MSSFIINHHSVRKNKGQIQVIFGPMFSGKTTELIRRLKRYQIANSLCLLIKYAHDNRYNTADVATHDKQTMPAVSTTSLEEWKHKALNVDVIGIDEGQFFLDIVEFSESLASQGKTVIVAALDGTFQREGFGKILHLVPLAENVTKLSAVCMKCFEEASYTKRLTEDTALEIIGGADKYMAVCRQCYYSVKQINDILTPESTPVRENKIRILFPPPPSSQKKDELGSETMIDTF